MIPIAADDTGITERLNGLFDLMKEQNIIQNTQNTDLDEDQKEAAIEQGYKNLLEAIRNQ